MNTAQFEKLVLGTLNAEIDWAALEGFLAPCSFTDLVLTAQNPAFHGEGDVLTHTRMVCGELVKMKRFQKLPQRQKAELFLASVLHDIGKAKTTRMENGVWISPHHSSIGSQIVRELLWREFGLCGTPEAMSFRETVCALVRFHMLPMHLFDQEEPERKVRQVASVGEVATDFNWEMLCLLAEADVRGRIADDMDDCLTQVHLSGLLAEEAGCFSQSYRFRDVFAKHAYLSGRNVQPDQILYDDTWGEVILLSALPGTGKDTWIRRNLPDLPVISLDDIRQELGADATGNQASVIHAAQDLAREYMRKKQPFIWNATNITREIRQEQIILFERYGASVKLIWLETPWVTELARNAARKASLPLEAIEELLKKTVPPMPDEARCVEWYCV